MEPARHSRTIVWIAACLMATWLVFVGFGGVREGSAARVAPEAERNRTAQEPIELAAIDAPTKLLEPDAPNGNEGMHPHPITSAHERIFRENNLVGALNLAVDYEDAPRIREIVAQYRAEYPQDEHRLQDGYAIIADCLEGPDPATRARAQQFWETQIRSQTRRYVRRYCLER